MRINGLSVVVLGLLAVSALVLVACAPTLSPSTTTSPLSTPGGAQPQPAGTASPVPAEPTPAVTGTISAPIAIPSEAQPVVNQTIQDLAQRLSVPADAVQVVSVTAVEWPDTSLGCPQPGMMYAQMVTPGYEVILEANGHQYSYHTGASSFVLCQKPGTGAQPTAPITATQPSIDPAAAPLVEQAKQNLAQQLNIPASSVAVVSVVAVEWPDSSLGCPQPGMNYMMVVTPGYLIKLDANGVTYEYHAGQRGGVVTCQSPQAPLSVK